MYLFFYLMKCAEYRSVDNFLTEYDISKCKTLSTVKKIKQKCSNTNITYLE